MADKPRLPGETRRHTLGVTVPPARPRTPSQHDVAPDTLPVEDRETILAWLRLVHESQLDLKASTEQRFAEHGRRIELVEKGILKIDTVDARLENIQQHILADARNDVMTQRDLGTLKAELARTSAQSGEAAGTLAGHDAGKRAARGPLIAAVIAAVVATVQLVPDLIRGLIKLLNQ